MIARILLLLFSLFLNSCSMLSAGRQKTVKPRYHHSYYKKHVYHKTPHVGRIYFRLFERQGVKTVKKN